MKIFRVYTNVCKVRHLGNITLTGPTAQATSRRLPVNVRITGFLALTVLIFTLAAVPARAQDESPLRFGVKLGMNISDFRGDDGIEGWGELLDWKIGFCGGVFMSYAVNDWFSVQPELLYSMKGMKIGFWELSATWSLDYIEVPVLAQFRLPFWSKLKPFACAGPAVGFNVRSKVSAGIYNEELGSFDLEEFTNTVDFSLVIGAGISFDIAGREIILEGRYVPGLSNVYTDEFGDVADLSIEQFNDTISILFGYAF
jgi:hypothetical protein